MSEIPIENTVNVNNDVDAAIDEKHWLSTDQLGKMFAMTSSLGNTYPKANDWKDYAQDAEDVGVSFDKARVDAFDQFKREEDSIQIKRSVVA